MFGCFTNFTISANSPNSFTGSSQLTTGYLMTIPNNVGLEKSYSWSVSELQLPYRPVVMRLHITEKAPKCQLDRLDLPNNNKQIGLLNNHIIHVMTTLAHFMTIITRIAKKLTQCGDSTYNCNNLWPKFWTPLWAWVEDYLYEFFKATLSYPHLRYHVKRNIFQSIYQGRLLPLLPCISQHNETSGILGKFN